MQAMYTRGPRSKGLHGDIDAAYISSFASLPSSCQFCVKKNSHHSDSQIIDSWNRNFGPDSDFFEPEDPRRILGGITPQQIRERLDTQSNELVKLQKKIVEVERRAEGERSQIQAQVNGFAAIARAAARQAKSEGADAIELAKLVHEHEVTRLKKAHVAEVAELKAQVEALESQLREKQGNHAEQGVPPQRQYPSTTGNILHPMRSRWTCMPLDKSPVLTTSTQTPWIGSEQSCPRQPLIEAPLWDDGLATSSKCGSSHTQEEDLPRQSPAPKPMPILPVQSEQEQSLLEKRMRDLHELYAATRITGLRRSAPPEEEKIGEKNDILKRLDATLGNVDVYPSRGSEGESGHAKRAGDEAGKEAIGSAGAGQRRTQILAATKKHSRNAAGAKALKGGEMKGTGASHRKSAATVSHKEFSRLDPTQYPALTVRNRYLFPQHADISFTAIPHAPENVQDFIQGSSSERRERRPEVDLEVASGGKARAKYQKEGREDEDEEDVESESQKENEDEEEEEGEKEQEEEEEEEEEEEDGDDNDDDDDDDDDEYEHGDDEENEEDENEYEDEEEDADDPQEGI